MPRRLWKRERQDRNRMAKRSWMRTKRNTGRETRVIALPHAHLQVPLENTFQFKVVVVFAKGVNERLGDFEPAHVEEELQQREDGHEEVDGSVGILLSRIQELTTQHREEEERIHRHRGHLEEGDGACGVIFLFLLFFPRWMC